MTFESTLFEFTGDIGQNRDNRGSAAERNSLLTADQVDHVWLDSQFAQT
jgi:hypothetical protein